jgi:hypothetical protein
MVRIKCFSIIELGNVTYKVQHLKAKRNGPQKNFVGHINDPQQIHILDVYFNCFTPEQRETGKVMRMVSLFKGVLKGFERTIGKNTLRNYPSQLAKQIGMPEWKLVKGHSCRVTAITVLAQKNFSVTNMKGVSGSSRIMSSLKVFKYV